MSTKNDEKKPLLDFVIKIDKLLSEVRNPALSRAEHSEILGGMQRLYDYVQNSEAVEKVEEKVIKKVENKKE